jgi:dTDP-glucose 4,6-dehydratase
MLTNSEAVRQADPDLVVHPAAESHVDALLLAACQGQLGRSYCVGGSGSNETARERTNKQVVEAICQALNQLLPPTAT